MCRFVYIHSFAGFAKSRINSVHQVKLAKVRLDFFIFIILFLDKILYPRLDTMMDQTLEWLQVLVL